MKVQNNLEQHSAYLEELLSMANKSREGMEEMKQRLNLLEYVSKEASGNMVTIIKNQKDFRDILDSIQYDYLKKKSWSDLLSDLISSPKKIMFVCGMLVSLATFVAVFEELFRHLLNPIFKIMGS